jgi:molybdopterin synthase sulfur carrier subunit
MFASAREAAGTARDDVPGETVGEVLNAARQRYGTAFADVLGTCRIWVNGDPAADATIVGPADEIAVLPPVSGGAVGAGRPSERQLHAACAGRRWGAGAQPPGMDGSL